MRKARRVVGAAPYTDTDPRAQIERVFRMARDFDVDIDMHLDLGDSAELMDVEYVCEHDRATSLRRARGDRPRHQDVVARRPSAFEPLARRLADAGVAVTVLPSTDLFLMGRGQRHSVVRGVLAAHELLQRGVNCSLSPTTC